jgi:SAM-dependent methyltransferase
MEASMRRFVHRLRRAARFARLAWRQRGWIAQTIERGGTAADGRRVVRDIHVPLLAIADLAPQPHYMAYSTCSAADFLDPRFVETCRLLREAPRFHRKLWEFVYIHHHLDHAGMLAEGRRGIGFGVGKEPLPAAFAARGAGVLATDAPPEIGQAAGWAATDQFAAGKATLPWQGICEQAAFERLVEFRHVDMTAIPAELAGFDFCWSACCLEHLGSLQAGLDFIVNTVEHVLRPGGVAVHTTEFNLSSNDATLEQGGTVIYRRRDIEAVIARLSAGGHAVGAFRVAPDSHPMDGWVDIPPYSQDAHLKLALGRFNCTSVGLVITRGP